MFLFCSYLFSSKQIELYDETFRQLVDSVLEGYNGMVFILIVNNIGNTNSINLQKKKFNIPVLSLLTTYSFVTLFPLFHTFFWFDLFLFLLFNNYIQLSINGHSVSGQLYLWKLFILVKLFINTFSYVDANTFEDVNWIFL